MVEGSRSKGIKNNGTDSNSDDRDSRCAGGCSVDDDSVGVDTVGPSLLTDFGGGSAGSKIREDKQVVIGVNCGHTLKGAGGGANGIINEAEHTRRVGYALMDMLRSAGIKVENCTIDAAKTQQEYLAGVVETANQKKVDLFISIHFNASASRKGQGVEVYTYEGRQYQDALEICENIAKLGFINRGVKVGNSLYVIRKTKARAMLIEVCFCDNEADVDIYNRVGAENAVAYAIYDGIYSHMAEWDRSERGQAASFEDYVGKIAKKDWEQRRIMLPSVVVAQAIKESAWGTSELARNANALFGIKKNGWTGRIYIKTAWEQQPDGSFYSVEGTQWRAYDSWEESVLDHNHYIATRSTDGGKSLRYGPVIGCKDYMLVCRYLQECGYATSGNYADSLINDYIRKYDLTKFDT